MSKITPYFPAASCVMAIVALPLALSAGALEPRMQAAASSIGIVLTLASLVLAIICIVMFRRGPLRHAVTAWIGEWWLTVVGLALHGAVAVGLRFLNLSAGARVALGARGVQGA